MLHVYMIGNILFETFYKMLEKYKNVIIIFDNDKWNRIADVRAEKIEKLDITIKFLNKSAFNEC